MALCYYFKGDIMKKIFLSLIALALILILGISFMACSNKAVAPSSSRKTFSKSPKSTSSAIVKTNSVEIVGDTVVHSFYYYGDSTEIVFAYKDGVLDSVVLTRECRDNSTAEQAYNNFEGINNHASSPLYEDIKLEGLTFSLKYTEFGMQNYQNMSKEELKIFLENESLEP